MENVGITTMVTNYINKSRSNFKKNKCYMVAIAIIIKQTEKTKTTGN